MGHSQQTTICGSHCCAECRRKEQCGGCLETGGSPFGSVCIAARRFKQGGLEAFQQLKEQLIREFNALNVPGLQVKDLNLLNGFYINLVYSLPNGQTVQLLEDKNIYLGNQVEIPGNDRCYGLAGDETHLLVCEYGCGGQDPEIVIYKRRKA